MSMDVDFEAQMTPEQFIEQIKQQEEAGIIQAQAEGRGPVQDTSIGHELHNVIHNYGKEHVPKMASVPWGVFAKQHPSLANLDPLETLKAKSMVRQFESLLSTALPKTLTTPKINRMIFQGKFLSYLNISKGKNGFEAQMTRSTMIGVAGFNKPAFTPNVASKTRPQSRWNRFRGMF